MHVYVHACVCVCVCGFWPALAWSPDCQWELSAAGGELNNGTVLNYDEVSAFIKLRRGEILTEYM